MKITMLACPTCGRVRALRRALRGWCETLVRYDRRPEIVVADDARDAADREACRAMLQDLRARYPFTFTYAGLDEKRRHASCLVRSGAAPGPVIEFALFGDPALGVSTGANRNALLLACQDEAFFSFDDDTLCRPARAPGSAAGLALFEEQRYSSSSPCDVWSFPSLRAALGFLEVRGEDPLDAHERLLGETVQECVSRNEREGRPDDAVDPGLARRASGCRARVRVTVNGYAGGSTWPAALGFLFLTGRSLERITTSRADYRAALRSRWVVQAVLRETLVERTNHAPALLLGLDHRAPLPPFLPVGRGQDILYWEVLGRAFEGAYVGHVPMVMPHVPRSARPFSWAGIHRTVLGLPLNRLLAALLREPGATGVRALGARLVETRRLSARAFAALVRDRVRAERVALFADLDRRLRCEAGGLADWRRDVSHFRTVAGLYLSSPWAGQPNDLRAGSGTSGTELLRDLAVRYGELLLAWPDLLEANRELRSRGHRPGASVRSVGG